MAIRADLTDSTPAETVHPDHHNDLANAVNSAAEVLIFSVTGTISAVAGKSRVYLEGDYVILTVRAAVDTAPTGASIRVDVNKNGTTIYTTQSARPEIAAGTNHGLGGAPAVTTFAAGDYITVDVDAVGSTVAGADLTVTIRLRREL
jgi:hypothetical protein